MKTQSVMAGLWAATVSALVTVNDRGIPVIDLMQLSADYPHCTGVSSALVSIQKDQCQMLWDDDWILSVDLVDDDITFARKGTVKKRNEVTERSIALTLWGGVGCGGNPIETLKEAGSVCTDSERAGSVEVQDINGNTVTVQVHKSAACQSDILHKQAVAVGQTACIVASPGLDLALGFIF